MPQVHFDTLLNNYLESQHYFDVLTIIGIKNERNVKNNYTSEKFTVTKIISRENFI